MKKILCALLFCIVLIFSISAATTEFGYYDANLDGCVELDDALTYLKIFLNNKGDDVPLLRVVQTLKASVASTAVNATVVEADTEARTVTFSIPNADNITLPYAPLGITDIPDAEALVGMPATLALENPVGEESDIYAALMGSHIGVQSSTGSQPASIKELNTKSESGSHVNDDFNAASVETSYRETVDLTKEHHHRFRLAFYPRVKKVKDDLYVMAYHIYELGKHIYFTTSEDSLTWNAPEILYNNDADYGKVPEYTDGPLAGKTDDKFVAVNPDICVLDNGELLLVFALRPSAGYRDYPDLSGIMLMRGTVNADNSVTWTEPEQITVGQLWEPFIWQREDGQVEIYWSNSAPYMNKYGYDVKVRSAGVSMIVSNDNGHTWAPSIEAAKSNDYLFARVYNEFLGYTRGEGADGNALSLLPIPYFGGQMPAVTRLYNGRSLLGVEVRTLNDRYMFSSAVSKENGDWDSLELTEDGPDNDSTRQLFVGAGPYLATFPSGEVYLTMHSDRGLLYEIGAPDGSAFTDKKFAVLPKATGMWGANELVGSHEVISAGQLKKAIITENADGTTTTSYEYGIEIAHTYLNHRINAQKTTINVDSNNSDWKNNTDAIFVGSESQAQLSVQVAHDDNNVYFLLSRIDNLLNAGDNASVCIAADSNAYYRIDITLTGDYTVTFCNGGNETVVSTGNAAYKLHGMVNNSNSDDIGALFELAIAKSDVGLENASSFKMLPSLINVDDGAAITDTLCVADDMACWPVVVLD